VKACRKQAKFLDVCQHAPISNFERIYNSSRGEEVTFSGWPLKNEIEMARYSGFQFSNSGISDFERLQTDAVPVLRGLDNFATASRLLRSSAEADFKASNSPQVIQTSEIQTILPQLRASSEAAQRQLCREVE
jgi:hypothetical protein